MVTNRKPFEWTRSDTLGIANHACVRCHGLGLADGRLESTQPCRCVLRAIFRACFEKFVEVAMRPRSRRDEEFLTDFVEIAKRTLSDELHRIFQIHFLLGAAPTLCIQQLGVDRGCFYHAVAQIEQQLGRAFRERQPHPLFPIYQYF